MLLDTCNKNYTKIFKELLQDEYGLAREYRISGGWKHRRILHPVAIPVSTDRPDAYKNTGGSEKKASLEMQSWKGNSLLEKHKTPFGSLSPISPRIKGLKTIEKGREGNLFPFL